MGLSRASAVALGAAIVAAAAVARAEPSSVPSFTEDEVRRLERGDLVTRSRTADVGGFVLVGGTAVQVVDAPPEAVWQAILDTPSYIHLLPEVAEARLVQRGRRNRVVFLRHAHGPLSASYHLRVDFDNAQHTVRFHVDRSRPRSLRQGHGVLIVQPWPGGRSVILWSVMADVDVGVLSGLARPQIHESMLRVPATIREYVEGPGRSRYVP